MSLIAHLKKHTFLQLFTIKYNIQNVLKRMKRCDKYLDVNSENIEHEKNNSPKLFAETAVQGKNVVQIIQTMYCILGQF